MAEGAYSIIEDAAMVTPEGFIEWIGPSAAAAPR
jgi:imidazolonepropionase